MAIDAGGLANFATSALTVGPHSLTAAFSGDTNQAGQFARSVPDFVLKGRFANQVKVDLHALEQEMGFAVKRSRAWWQRILKR